MAVLVALVTSRPLDVVDDGGLATRFANSLSTAGANARPDSLPTSTNVNNRGAMKDTQRLREAIDELMAKGLSDDGSVLPNAVGETATLSPIDTSRAVVDETSSIATQNSHKSGGNPRKRIQRRAKAIAQRDPSNKYHQVPKGAEKMFDANWQNKAFAYQ